VVHWEFGSDNPTGTSEFYRKVFDWNNRTIPDQDYHLDETGVTGGINGGIMKPKRGPWPGKLAVYIDVDDLDRYSWKIRENGGRIIVDQVEAPGVGQLSLFEDPDGRALGMWKQHR
jgi:predicted enzyme related to lactoylglutathione lyase